MNIKQLNFTRFLVAILIVILHSGLRAFPFNYSPVKLGFLNSLVSYFFVLSGFVLVIAYEKFKEINFRLFIKKRFIRIYPVYFLALILILGFLLFYSLDIDYKAVILNLFFLQAWIPQKALSFNYPAWALSVEFFFYLIFPFLYNKIYKKISFKKITLLIFGFWLLNQIIYLFFVNRSLENNNFSVYKNFLFFFPLLHFSSFLIGNCAGFLVLRKKNWKPKNFDIFLIAILVLILFLFFYFKGVFFHNGLLAPLFILILIFLSFNNGFFTWLFNRRIFIFLGDISYGIYILQVPVYKWAPKLMPFISKLGVSFKFYFSTLIIILLASLSYLFIEKPLRERMKKKNSVRNEKNK